jgi:5-methylcytosine-specific restriction endonuclease McrA
LSLDQANLQVLCATCNAGKGNWDKTDWRDIDRTLDAEHLVLLREQGLLN